MEAATLSDVQLANLSMLRAIKASIGHDRVSASSKFGLKSDDLVTLANLSQERLLAIVANMGQESLFPPRVDLSRVLTAPPVPSRAPKASDATLRRLMESAAVLAAN